MVTYLLLIYYCTAASTDEVNLEIDEWSIFDQSKPFAVCIKHKLWPKIQLLTDAFTLTAYGQRLKYFTVEIRNLSCAETTLTNRRVEALTKMLDIQPKTAVSSYLSL